jgi:hypothetical protein
MLCLYLDVVYHFIIQNLDKFASSAVSQIYKTIPLGVMNIILQTHNVSGDRHWLFVIQLPYDHSQLIIKKHSPGTIEVWYLKTNLNL